MHDNRLRLWSSDGKKTGFDRRRTISTVTTSFSGKNATMADK